MHKQIAAAVLGLALVSGCSKPEPTATITPVEVRKVQTAGGADGLIYSAQVEPDTQINIAFRTDGYVTEIANRPGVEDGKLRLLQTGDVVSKGEVLARIETEEYDDKVATAQANLDKANAMTHKAQQDYKRAKALQATDSITGPDFDSAEAAYQTAVASEQGASAQLDKAKSKLGDTALVAPQDGTILQRKIEIGSLVHSNSIGFVLAKTDIVKVVFGLPDLVLQEVKLGSKMKVRTSAYPKRLFEGVITEIAAGADQRSHLFDVSLTVDNSDGSLRPGMVASLDLNAKTLSTDVISIPLKAIVADKKGGFAVYLAEISGDKAVAKLTEVTTGEVLGNNIIISSGLQGGETVIVTGTSQVKDGQSVNIIP